MMVSCFAACMHLSDEIIALLKLKGPKHDHVPAREFICQVYLRENPDKDRQCYSHFTVATGYRRSSLTLAETSLACPVVATVVAPL